MLASTPRRPARAADEPQCIACVEHLCCHGRAVYDERIETLIAAMSADPGVRLPGQRREVLAGEAAKDGVEIPSALYRQLLELAGQT